MCDAISIKAAIATPFVIDWVSSDCALTPAAAPYRINNDMNAKIGSREREREAAVLDLYVCFLETIEQPMSMVELERQGISKTL
jgi:hypothetical protein